MIDSRNHGGRTAILNYVNTLKGGPAFSPKRTPALPDFDKDGPGDPSKRRSLTNAQNSEEYSPDREQASVGSVVSSISPIV